MLAGENRLRKEKDIKTLFAKGKGVFGVLCGLRVRVNQLPVTRFAVVVGSKVSKKAVVRNRIRRVLQAELSNILPNIKPGFDIMVLIRPAAKEAPPAELRKQLRDVLVKAKLLEIV